MEKRSMTVMVSLAASAVLVLALLGAYVLGGGRSEAVAAPGGDQTVRKVTSSGTGTAMGTPDVMRFTVGVDITRADVGAAVDDSNALMTKVLKAARKAGVAEKDIKTARYSIDPRYDYSGNTERLTGYTVSQRARITLRHLDKAGAAITAISRAGGNDVRVQGVAFEVSDPDALLDEARADAVAQARAHAKVYAEAAGAELGEVIVISEATATQRNDQEVYALADMAVAKAAPIEPGETELTVQVTVSWAVE